MNKLAKIMAVAIGAASLCLAASGAALAAQPQSQNSNCRKGHHCPPSQPQKHNNRKESKDCSSGTVNQNIKRTNQRYRDILKLSADSDSAE